MSCDLFTYRNRCGVFQDLLPYFPHLEAVTVSVEGGMMAEVARTTRSTTDVRCLRRCSAEIRTVSMASCLWRPSSAPCCRRCRHVNTHTSTCA